MQYDIINVTVFFFIYGFSGFLLETAFRSIVNKRLYVSRGFLTNFFLPLYGLCGVMIIMIFTLSEITMDRLSGLIFATIASIISVTFLEYATGRILDQVFHCKLWDYTDLPYNLHSYICLDFSLGWGVIALILAGIIHPLMEIVVYAIPDTTKLIFSYFVSCVLFVNASYNMRKMYHLSSRV